MSVKYSPYEVLDISLEATPREIKRAYKKLVRIHTPEHDPEKFMAIRNSYELLMEQKINNVEVIHFPIYKSPYDQTYREAGTDNTALPKDILADFFETPFNTFDLASKLLKKSETALGFTSDK